MRPVTQPPRRPPARRRSPRRAGLGSPVVEQAVSQGAGPAASLRRTPAHRPAPPRPAPPCTAPHLFPHVVHDAHEPRQQLGFFASRKFLLSFLLATLFHAGGGHPLFALCGFAATVCPPHAAVWSTASAAELGELRESRRRTRRSQLGHGCKRRESQACALGRARGVAL